MRRSCLAPLFPGHLQGEKASLTSEDKCGHVLYIPESFKKEKDKSYGDKRYCSPLVAVRPAPGLPHWYRVTCSEVFRFKMTARVVPSLSQGISSQPSPRL